VAGYIPVWFYHPHMVTHPSTNLARRRVTALIETNAHHANSPVVLRMEGSDFEEVSVSGG